MKSATPVRPADFLSSVFARDETLVDIIARHAPHLAKLRNSPMRRIMARVTTVAQAARLCGVPVDSLVAELNDALGFASEPQLSGTSRRESSDLDDPHVETTAPEFAGKTVVALDVREDLRKGNEPFSAIMAAVGALRADQVLHLRTTFEPVPLFTVMGKRGFAHTSLRHAADDWSVWFHRADEAAESPKETRAAPEASQSHAPADALSDVRIDVRGLEPPEPMVRTLEALETLPAARALLHVNVRVPQLLLPILRERGFDFQIDESHRGEVHVRIWRRSSAPSPSP